MLELKRTNDPGYTECNGCDSTKDIYSLRVSANKYQFQVVRLCKDCRRELYNEIKEEFDNGGAYPCC